jgi:hypothetical protein
MLNLLGRSKPCDHEESITTHNYGLIRTVCMKCGMVHIEAVRPEPRMDDPQDSDQDDPEPVAVG